MAVLTPEEVAKLRRLMEKKKAAEERAKAREAAKETPEGKKAEADKAKKKADKAAEKAAEKAGKPAKAKPSAEAAAKKRADKKAETIAAAIATAAEKQKAAAEIAEKKRLDDAVESIVRPKKEAPTDDASLVWRVSSSVRGARGGFERMRWHRRTRDEALALATERVSEADKDVVIRDLRSSEAWNVSSRGGTGIGPADPRRISLTPRKAAKKPSGYQLWRLMGGKQITHGEPSRKLTDAEAKADWLRKSGMQVFVRPTYA